MKINLNKSDRYFILFLLVLIVLIWLNEAGYGAIAFLPLMLLEVWIMKNIYEKENPDV
jgi:hypothetical protein